MDIPAIAAYPMPRESALPANVVSWRPQADRVVLLIHDMQRYFADFFPAGEPLAPLIANIRRLRDTAATLGIPVVYTAQTGAMTREQRGLLHDLWGPGMSADPAATQIVPELAPGPHDLVLAKWRYSAFCRSDLETVVRRAGRDQLAVCGVYAHVGCLMTACDAFSRDIQPFLVADAVADFTPQYHQWALEYAAGRCAVTISTRAMLADLRATAARRRPVPPAAAAQSMAGSPAAAARSAAGSPAAD